MKYYLQFVGVLLLSTAALSTATATTTTYDIPVNAEIQLKYGTNEVRTGDMVLHIVKSFVGTHTASGFDTYTTYVLPDKKSERWLLVTSPADKGIGYNFRNYETGDANLRAVSFYKEGGQLFAVAAERDKATTTETRMKKGGVVFQIYKFNGDWDMPQFDLDGSIRARRQYQDAADALKREFYKR